MCGIGGAGYRDAIAWRLVRPLAALLQIDSGDRVVGQGRSTREHASGRAGVFYSRQ